ncbi:MAG TPA: hypothetical protein VIV40_20295, partial [Kofleriaceae bacterium]
FYPIRFDELNTDVQNATAMTATNSNGVYWNTGAYQSCTDWTTNQATAPGMVGGFAHSNSANFTNFAGFQCSQLQRLYCFQTDNQAVVAPPVVSHRIAFTSSTNWTPGGGLSAADAVCTADAQAAGLTSGGRTYKALLATTTASAISRFNTAAGTLPWGRPDHTLVTASANTLAQASTTFIDASPNGNAANTLWFGNVQVWSGASSLTALGTTASTCSNWALTSGTGTGGRAGSTRIQDWLAYDSSNACSSTTIRLICLQE